MTLALQALQLMQQLNTNIYYIIISISNFIVLTFQINLYRADCQSLVSLYSLYASKLQLKKPLIYLCHQKKREIARRTNNRWGKTFLECRPRTGKRNVRRSPILNQTDDMARVAGDQCIHWLQVISSRWSVITEV